MENRIKIKSDLLHILENISSSVRLYMEVMSEASQRAFAEGIAAECFTLSLKLRAMHKRWEVYLPFHECQDVKFDVWERLLGKKIYSLKNGRYSANEGDHYYSPGSKFWLDVTEETLYLPQFPPDQLKEDVKSYVARVDEQLDKLETTIEGEEDNADINVLVKALTELKKLLWELHHFFHADKTDEQYLRLSLRLYERFCKEIENEVEDECNKWMVEWPKRLRKSKATKKRDLLLDELTAWDEQKERWKLSEYCDFAQLNPLEDPDFGQFLFVSRHKLEEKEVVWLFKICLEIQWMNRLIQGQSVQSTEEKRTVQPTLSVEEQRILDRLMELCELGEWQNGMTVERMKEGWRGMLMTGTLNEAHRKLSRDLWTLYRQRPKCNGPEKSLQVTWLNFIGWCQRNQFIAGSSPQLCRSFFPKAEVDAYKAIDKGRNQDVKSFERITPLFETCLQQQNKGR